MPRRPAEAAAQHDPATEAPPPSGVEFHVDDHGAPRLSGEDKEPAAVPGVEPPEQAILPGALWTPEEAGQLVCAVFNLGILVYGPEWAARPEETSGWNISLAQLLDVYMPRGSGGYVELGAGLFMVGSGLAMMTVNRVPLIKRGPRPLWVKKPDAQPQPTDGNRPPAAAPAAAKEPAPPDGSAYRIPRDLAASIPASDPGLVGLGYEG